MKFGSSLSVRETILFATVLLLTGFSFGAVCSHFPAAAWSSQDVIAFLSMIAAFIGAGATIAVAIVVGEFSKRVARAEALREVASQWQDFNLMISSNRDVASLLAKNEMKAFSTDEVRLVYLTFFKLTNLDQISSLKREELIDDIWADKLIADIIGTLPKNQKIIEFVLDDRGYATEFVESIKAELARRSNAAS